METIEMSNCCASGRVSFLGGLSLVCMCVCLCARARPAALPEGRGGVSDCRA